MKGGVGSLQQGTRLACGVERVLKTLFCLAECILFLQAVRRLPLSVLTGVSLRRVAAGMAPNPWLEVPPVAGVASRVDRRTYRLEMLFVRYCHGFLSDG